MRPCGNEPGRPPVLTRAEAERRFVGSDGAQPDPRRGPCGPLWARTWRKLVEETSGEVRLAKGLTSDEVPDCPLRAGTCGGVWCVLCVNFVGKL